MLGQRLNCLRKVRRFRLCPRCDCPLHQGQSLVWHHQPLIKEQLHPQPVTDRARPIRRVETEQPRFNLGNRKPRYRARKLLRIGDPRRIITLRHFHHRNPVRQVQRGAETVGQPRLQPFAYHDAVDHHVDVMTEFLVQHRRFVQFMEHPVHLDALIALLAQVDEIFLILALPVPDDRRQQIGSRALGHRHHRIHHILHLHRRDRQSGGR